MQNLNPLLKEIKDSISDMTELKSTMFSTDLKYGLQIFLTKKFVNPQTNSLYQMIIGHALSAEKACSGCGLSLLKRFCNLNLEYSEDISFTRKSIKKMMSELDIFEKDQNLLSTAFDLASFNGKISIKRSRGLISFVEMHEGYSFNISPALAKTKSVEIYNPFVLFIDGYIESVSEINTILEWSSEVKKPLILTCRGFDKDVLHTIKVNNDRGSFSIHPFIVPFDHDNVNTMVDMSVVCMTDVISSLKGNLISNIDTSSIKSVESVILSDRLSIRNDKSKTLVENHVRNINKKIDERPELKDILSERIKSLTSRSIDIYIPDDNRFTSTSHKIDLLLRWVKDRVSLRLDPKKITDFYYESLCKSLDSIGHIVA